MTDLEALEHHLLTDHGADPAHEHPRTLLNLSRVHAVAHLEFRADGDYPDHDH